MTGSLLSRIDGFVRTHGLIAPGGAVTCLVSGGQDSTCLWHALRALGFEVRAVHVHHGVRGPEADLDAEHCARALGADVVRVRPRRGDEAELRELRYDATASYGLRATGHTATDQLETVLYRLVSSGSTRGIRRRRDDGVVRPLLELTREETAAYCDEQGLPVRVDRSNADTKRGLIREELVPLLRRLDGRAEANLLALAAREPLLPRALERSLADLLSSRSGTTSADLGGGVRAVRRYDELTLEGEVSWGPWTLSSRREGLTVRSRRPGDRLAGRRKKVQDLLVDAKIPRDERDEWPLVVSHGQVVSVPGVAEAPGWEGVVNATREGRC